jgi:catechol-2,3-dioxygenase
MKIHSIQLNTASLAKVVAFYRDALGLGVLTTEPGKAHVPVGNSWLIFSENPGLEGSYHFACNIPCNQIREGMAWLERAGITLIANEKNEQRIDFPNWNAEACYFLDPAGNIVELIARRDLHNESEQFFGPASLLEISEIGIATDDVTTWIEQAERSFGISAFDKQKPAAEFAAIGSDTGLFIVAKTGRKWLLTDIPAAKLPLEVNFENERGEMFNLAV